MPSFITEEKARALVCDIGKKMAAKQFVAANDGNITVRIGENAFIATPTGVNKGDLRPELLLTTDIDGNILAGTMRPTSELFMHMNVYKTDPRVQSTCHAHSIYLSAYAIAGLDIDMAISPETSLLVGSIPVVPYSPTGSGGLADSIRPFVNDHSIVLLANHGPLSWGHAPEQAWFVLEAAEAYAIECTLLKYVIREARMLSNDQLRALGKQHHVDMDGPRRTSGVREEVNTARGTSLAEAALPPATLSEADIERIADRVAAKLRAAE